MTQVNANLLGLHKNLALFGAGLFMLSLVLCGLGLWGDRVGNKNLLWLMWFGGIGIGATLVPTVLHAALYALGRKYVQAGTICSRIVGVLYLFFFPIGTVLGVIILLASQKTNRP